MVGPLMTPRSRSVSDARCDGGTNLKRLCHMRFSRCAKIKSAAHLGKAFLHNVRTSRVTNADPERLATNEVLVPCDDVHAAWVARVGSRTVRKNAVLAVEVLLARSPDWVGDESEWVKRSQAWLEDQFGAENVLSSVVHRDQTTPHLQALTVPIDSRGKLNCRAFLGGKAKLVRLQDSYAEAMAPLGLERGRQGSTASHQTTREHLLRALDEARKERDEARKERDELREALRFVCVPPVEGMAKTVPV